METSDSECFESADESFYSDDEDTPTVIASKLKNVKVQDSKNKPECQSENKDKKSVEGASREVEKTATDIVNNLETQQSKNVEAKADTQSESKDSAACDRKPAEISSKVVKDVGMPTTVDLKEVQHSANLETLDPRSEHKESISCDKNVTSEEVKEQTTATSNKLGVNVPKTEINSTPQQEELNLWDDDDDWGNLSTETDPTVYDNTQLPSNLKKGKLVSKYDPDEDKWEFDSWEPLNDDKTQNQEQDTSKSSWGSWGNWGMTSILSTATQGVSTLTSQVSQGLSNVLETGIGVPDPEELAKINHQQQNDNERTAACENNNPSSGFGFGNIVSGVSQITKIVESTGTRVISSGLDTLETIGKKTMEVLQEGDPGLKKKRAFLQINRERPALSQLLREIKEKAENENKILEQKHFAKKANYESIFDDHQGLVHLEALEMLSRQCDIKLETVLETYSGETLKEVQETMEQVKELCEIPDEEEEEVLSMEEIKNKLENAVAEIGIPITYNKLVTTWQETEEWLSKLNLSVCSEQELHQQAIETLAQLTAMAVEQFHKGGELLLIKEHRSTADEADSLVQ